MSGFFVGTEAGEDGQLSTAVSLNPIIDPKLMNLNKTAVANKTGLAGKPRQVSDQ